VSAGTVEACHTCSYYAIGKDPTFTFGTCLPFGLNPRQMNAWLQFGGGNTLLNEFYAQYNMYSLPAGNSGVQMGGWFRKEINSVEDLRGLKFRVGGLAGRILQKLGVVPQMLAGGDVYPALERGTIDAVEWSGPYDDEKLGFHKVARYYYYPGWWDGGTVISVMFNLARWNELPAAYKAVLTAAAGEANVWMQAKYDAENPAAIRRLVAAGAQLRAFNNTVMDASYKAAMDTYAEISSTNPAFKKMLDSYVAFRADQYLWWQVAEYSFDSYLIRARHAQARN
jgi:TRAP-type mannitol/chloroaromatic compound transport system substrate-binding protein